MFRREVRKGRIAPRGCRTNHCRSMRSLNRLPQKDRALLEAEIAKPDPAARFGRSNGTDREHPERFPPRQPKNSLRLKAAWISCDHQGEQHERQLALLLAPRPENCIYPPVTRQRREVYRS